MQHPVYGINTETYNTKAGKHILEYSMF